MKFSKCAAALAAVSLAASPVVASAATVDRASAPVSGESEIGGGNTIGILALFAIAAFTIGIFVAGDDEEEAISA